MEFLNTINVITVILIAIFVIPILVGVIVPFSGDRMRRSFSSLRASLILLAAVIGSVYLTGLLLTDPESAFLTQVYRAIPPLHSLLTSQNLLTYIIIALVLLALLSALLFLVTMPLYRFVVVPATEKISAAMGRMNTVLRRVLGGIWELPKALVTVILFSLLLNLCVSYNLNDAVSKTVTASTAYQTIDKTLLEPILSSGLAKRIPVLLSETFKDAAASLEARNIHLIRYFNGMTLDEAVKSNADIDAAAHKIVGKETDQKAKAKLIYAWITKNIKYDDKKAAIVATNPSSVSSGAVVAYNTRTGICFDYACLYVAMCRAADVKVRFVTGLGYSGAEWGDHAWNQVYDPAQNRWINVDTTFGSTGGNYFDRANFDADHQNAVVQGEW